MSDELMKAKAEMLSLIQAGDLHASCPFEGMDEPWTEEEKATLKAAFAEMFGWKLDPVDSNT